MTVGHGPSEGRGPGQVARPARTRGRGRWTTQGGSGRGRHFSEGDISPLSKSLRKMFPESSTCTRTRVPLLRGLILFPESRGASRERAARTAIISHVRFCGVSAPANPWAYSPPQHAQGAREPLPVRRGAHGRPGEPAQGGPIPG